MKLWAVLVAAAAVAAAGDHPRLLARRASLARAGGEDSGRHLDAGGHAGTIVRSFSLAWEEASPPKSPPAKVEAPPAKALLTKAPQSPRSVFAIDASPDPHKVWSCLHVQQSRIPSAGDGLFAAPKSAQCANGLAKDTLIGEYRGMRFMMGEHGANKRLQADWSYIWKVPRCKANLTAPVVITRTDKAAAHQCSSKNGFVYVDAYPLEKKAENPLRYVNGLLWSEQGGKKAAVGQANVEAFFADDRVFYYTFRAVAPDEELIVDYGPAYWQESKSSRGGDSVDAQQKAQEESFAADWGDFVSDGF